jgi:hypothetical protein
MSGTELGEMDVDISTLQSEEKAKLRKVLVANQNWGFYDKLTSARSTLAAEIKSRSEGAAPPVSASAPTGSISRGKYKGQEGEVLGESKEWPGYVDVKMSDGAVICLSASSVKMKDGSSPLDGKKASSSSADLTLASPPPAVIAAAPKVTPAPKAPVASGARALAEKMSGDITDPTDREFAVEALTPLAEKYPKVMAGMKPVGEADIANPKALGHYSPAENQIRLASGWDPRARRQSNASARASGYTVSGRGNFSDFYTHEFGHAVDQYITNKLSPGSRMNYSLWKNKLHSKYQASRYGKKNPEESFAESFVIHSTWPTESWPPYVVELDQWLKRAR